MLAVARCYEGGATRADDIVQDASIKALALTDTIPAVENPRRWLRTITRHAGLRAVTKRRRRAELFAHGVADPTVELGRRDRVLDDWEEECGQLKKLGVVMDAVGFLSSAQLEVFWRRLQGEQDNEIATALNITKTTVRVRWHRAVKMLRTRLVENGRATLRS